MLLRPFFYYFGGKWMQARKYPAPEHNTVIEPFAGSAGYATRYHDRKVILIEKYPVVAALWRWLIKVSSKEVLKIPLLGADDTVDDLGAVAEEAKTLVGFRIVVATAVPATRPGSWMRRKLANPIHSKNNQVAWGDTFWCERVRARIADQVQYIRHWKVIEGDYTDAPDVKATWFVDPPYQGPGKSYKVCDVDYQQLARWCRKRRGQTIVCEQEGADWLNFKPFAEVKSTKGTSKEMIWVRNDTGLSFRKFDMKEYEAKLRQKEASDHEQLVVGVLKQNEVAHISEITVRVFGVSNNDDERVKLDRRTRNAVRWGIACGQLKRLGNGMYQRVA